MTTYNMQPDEYSLASDIQMMRFPQITKVGQYKSLKNLVDKGVFDEIGTVEYCRYRNREEVTIGLDNLKKDLEEIGSRFEGR